MLPGEVTMMVTSPEAVAAQAGPKAALAEGVFFTRDLTNEPANVLTPHDFAARLAAMQDLGLNVEIMEEPAMKALGMNAPDTPTAVLPVNGRRARRFSTAW